MRALASRISDLHHSVARQFPLDREAPLSEVRSGVPFPDRGKPRADPDVGEQAELAPGRLVDASLKGFVNEAYCVTFESREGVHEVPTRNPGPSGELTCARVRP